MKILEVRELRKYYGSDDTMVKALDGVSFDVESGEFISIVGTSGSGKSTLLHMVGGLDAPTSGEVIIEGKNIADMSADEISIFRRRNIGFIFQSYNLVPMLNVYENLVLPLELDGMAPDKHFVEEVLHMIGLESKINSFPNTLSGGQQQRVAIARSRVEASDHTRG